MFRKYFSWARILVSREWLQPLEDSNFLVGFSFVRARFGFIPNLRHCDLSINFWRVWICHGREERMKTLCLWHGSRAQERKKFLLNQFCQITTSSKHVSCSVLCDVHRWHKIIHVFCQYSIFWHRCPLQPTSMITVFYHNLYQDGVKCADGFESSVITNTQLCGISQ